MRAKPLGQLKASNWDRRTSRQKRGYGREHDEIRALVLVEEPLCRPCLAAGRVSATVIADHITPLSEGGPTDRSNYQGICRPCHNAKTAAETQKLLAGADQAAATAEEAARKWRRESEFMGRKGETG